MDMDKIVIVVISSITLIIVGVILVTSLKNKIDLSKELLVTETSNKKGTDNPKATLVVFSDYNCSVCARVEPILADLTEKNKDSLQLVHRYFPLNKEGSLIAAKAAQAASRQDKFWEYNKTLFENQPNFSRSDLIQYAKELNLDIDTFSNDIDSQEVLKIVQDDLNLAKKLRLAGTPSLFIINENGEVNEVKINNFDDIEKVVNEAIGKKTDVDQQSTNSNMNETTNIDESRIIGLERLSPEEKEIALKVVNKHLLNNNADQSKVERIEVLLVEKRQWSDTSLGCPKEGQVYAQIITPGFLIQLKVLGNIYNYHTDAGDNIVLCSNIK